MSLYVYTDKKDIPEGMKYVRVNDSYFLAKTPIQDTPLVHKILREVDEARYYNEISFIDRAGNLQPKQNLSTGTKTLLNIISYPGICFDVLCCGDNALEFLAKIHEGYVFWSRPFMWYGGEDKSCDIICNGKHYTNIFDFIGEFMEKEDEDEIW